MTEPYYEVIDAEYGDEAFLPPTWRIPAQPNGRDEWAMDEEEAACLWAEERWSDYDHPEEMEAIVTHSDGRKWKVNVKVEMRPAFVGSSTEVKP